MNGRHKTLKLQVLLVAVVTLGVLHALAYGDANEPAAEKLPASFVRGPINTSEYQSRNAYVQRRCL